MIQQLSETQSRKKLENQKEDPNNLENSNSEGNEEPNSNFFDKIKKILGLYSLIR